MNKSRLPAVLVALGACIAVTARAQAPDQAAVTAAGRTLEVHPTVEPAPVLKYRLLPPFYERKPGNAAVLYKTAALLLAQHQDEPSLEKVADWLAMPLAELPQEEAERALSAFSNELRHVEMGARRERCEWDWPLEEGASMLLPDMAAYRDIARLLALKARLQVLKRDYDGAVDTLRTGFSFAFHVAEGPVLINDLVGMAMTNLLLDAAEDLVQAPDAPSLYWALSALPSPFICVRDAIEFELGGMAFWPKELRHPEGISLNPKGWAAVFEDFTGLLHGVAGRRNQPASAAIALGTYTDAKRHLVQQGEPLERVEAMPVLQVVAIYLRDGWRTHADEALTWWYTPYPQARADADKMERIAAEARTRTDGLFVALLMPALGRARFEQVRLDRKIAGLRIVEALRLHAAAAGGRLPSRLAEVREVPIPLNPMRDEPFSYSLRGDRAVLSAPFEREDTPEKALRYQIKIAR